jgi:glycosyltransferase involved in cell wall biosynthesis
MTAGAAEMYCGSCLRDNALASALKARGHDVVLTPLYTPTTTDEKNVSEHRVLFGGVSVYLEQYLPLFRHTPAALDWIWDSTPVLRLASKRQIKVDPTLLGEMTVSMLKGLEGFQKKEVLKMLRWLEHEQPFTAVTLPFALLIGLARPLKDALKVPIVCTLQGEDLFLEQLREPWRSQALALIRQKVNDVDRFIAVSDYYLGFMSKYLGVAPDRMRKVPIGISLDGHEVRRAYDDRPFTIGFFARIAPEKGLHVLADAYIRLRARSNAPPTRLFIGGYLLSEHREYFNGVMRQLEKAGLASHVRYAGAPTREDKIRLMHGMDVMSMPATYDEPKGLSLLEAMANGVPVVEPRRGAFPEIIERTHGGLLVPPDDPDALADALLSLALDRPRAATMGREGADGVRRHYTADHMADAAERVYAELGR